MVSEYKYQPVFPQFPHTEREAKKEYARISPELSLRDKIILNKCFLGGKNTPYHYVAVYSTNIYGFVFMAKPHPDPKDAWTKCMVDRDEKFGLQCLCAPLMFLGKSGPERRLHGNDKEEYYFIKDVFPEDLLDKIDKATPYYTVDTPNFYRRVLVIKNRKLLDACKDCAASKYDFSALDKTLLEQCTDKELKKLQLKINKTRIFE